MNITSNPSLLTSLTSLLDPNVRQQQQTLQDQQNLRQQQKAAEQTSKIAENTDRQNRIDANRNALRELQARLKADNLAKLKTDLATQQGNGGTGQSARRNLRESPGTSNRVTNTNSRPGQIIDIRV